jgi:hypothetical protein
MTDCGIAPEAISGLSLAGAKNSPLGISRSRPPMAVPRVSWLAPQSDMRTPEKCQSPLRMVLLRKALAEQ